MSVGLPSAANFAAAPMRRGLRGLAAGVRVDLRVQHEHVHVVNRRQHVVETAVADVERPSVAAHEPDGPPNQVVRARVQCARFVAAELREGSPERFDVGALLAIAGLVPRIRRGERTDESFGQLRCHALEEQPRPLLPGRGREAEAQPELRVVLEQRIRPGRSAAMRIARIRRRRQVAPVDRRATGGVGDQQPVPEQLRQQLDVRRLAAARARPRVLEQRGEELRLLDVDPRHRRAVHLGEPEEERVARPLGITHSGERRHVDRLVARLRLVLRRAHGHAESTTGAVLRRDLDRVPLPRVVGGPVVDRAERARRIGQRTGCVDLGADRGVRTHERALVALDADRGVPDRHLLRDRPLLPPRRARRPRSVDRERADRQAVARARPSARP